MRIVSLVLWLLLAPLLSAAPLNLRHPAPSPDGSQICFSYQGDLWVVSRSGGQPSRLTGNAGYDCYPAWSPDGSYIAFSSDRYGDLDVFVIPSSGGQAMRATYNTADDIVSGWSSDGKEVIFDSERELPNHCIWAVNPATRRPYPLTRIRSFEGRELPNDNKLVFTSGDIPWWRQGYHGAAATDIYVKDLGNNQIARFTAYNGCDLEPQWLPGGEDIIYLSDTTGSFNVFKKNLRTGATEQLTQHRLNAHHLRVAADGSLAAYELDGEIFLYDLVAGQGSKLKLDFAADDSENRTAFNEYSSGATEMALAPDGSQLAFVVGGEIYCIDGSGTSLRRLTRTLATECNIAWSADSRELSYVANTDGNDDVYTLSSGDVEESRLAFSFSPQSKRLLATEEFESDPVISPDGRQIAVVRNQSELDLITRNGLETRTLFTGGRIEDLVWSPDGRYLVFTKRDGDWYRDIFLADAESGKIANITQYPGNYAAPAFDGSGQMLYFIHNGKASYLFLERFLDEMKPAELDHLLQTNGNGQGLKSRPVRVDFDRISRRVRELSGPADAEQLVLLPMSWNFAVATSTGDLWEITLDGKRRLIAANLGPIEDLGVGHDGSELYFRGRDGRLLVVETASGLLQELPYHVEIEVDRNQRRLAMFDNIVALLQQRFYDEKLRGVPFNELQSHCRDRIAAVRTDDDFYDLVNEFLGAFNVSHLALWPAPEDRSETGQLGIIPDYDYDANGLRIEKVIPGTPADYVNVSLQPGEKITAVDGESVGERDNFYRFLYGTVGQPLQFDLINRDAITRSVVITPLSTAQLAAARYRAGQAERRSLVEAEGEGLIAYAQLRQFDNDVVEDFERQVAADAGAKSALLLDLRDNVGGTAHDRLLQLIEGKTYVERRPRQGSDGADSRLPFEGPIYLLVNEGTSSDAEIFAYGFQRLGLGKILGTPTNGAVIGTETVPLADGSTLAIPTIGWYTPDGASLEGHGIQPDVLLERNPTVDEKGDDSLLRKAIDYIKGGLQTEN